MGHSERGETPTVLVVDDEQDLADLYTAWLADEYDVRTAYSGEEAIELMDDAVDVALIDRLMPRVSGDAVLEHLHEEGYNCRISMVTAVEPDFDIIEMGFDEYIVKPLERSELKSVVESLHSRMTYDEQLQEFYSLAAKRAALQAQKSPQELDENESYTELTERIEELSANLEQTTGDLSHRDFEVEFRQMNDEAV